MWKLLDSRQNVHQKEYYNLEYGNVFLLTNVSPSLKLKPQNKYSDTLNLIDTSLKKLWIIFDNELKVSLNFDVNQRFDIKQD